MLLINGDLLLPWWTDKKLPLILRVSFKVLKPFITVAGTLSLLLLPTCRSYFFETYSTTAGASLGAIKVEQLTVVGAFVISFKHPLQGSNPMKEEKIISPSFGVPIIRRDERDSLRSL